MKLCLTWKSIWSTLVDFNLPYLEMFIVLKHSSLLEGLTIEIVSSNWEPVSLLYTKSCISEKKPTHERLHFNKYVQI